MTEKSTRFAFTAFEDQWPLFNEMPQSIAEWGWQKEVCPQTGKQHYQGYLRTIKQERFSALKRLFPGVHLEVAQNWAALKAYCMKSDTAVPGTQVQEHSKYMNKFQFLEYLIKICIHLYGFDQIWALDKPKIIDLVMQEAQQQVLNHPYIVWIIEDPNFKQVLKNQIRPLLIAYKET